MTDDIIVFDIETRLCPARYLPSYKPFTKPAPEKTEFDPSTVKLGAMKDPEKIEAKISAARDKHVEDYVLAVKAHKEAAGDYYAKQADKAALYPGQSEICAIGWQVPGEEPVTLMLGDEGIETEEDLLVPFIALFREVTESPVTAGGNFRFGFYSGNSKRDSYFDLVHIREAGEHGVPRPARAAPVAVG